jgi:hypothetical protein
MASLLVSCAPLRPNLVGEPLSGSFADELIHQWYESSARVRSLQGLAKVTVQAPLNSLNGSQVIIAQKPGSLRAETLSPFGSPLLLLAAHDGSLDVSLPAENVYYTGAATPENLDLFVHLPLRLNDLINVLLYQPPLITAWKQEAFMIEKGGWLLKRYGTLSRQEMIFNLDRQLIEVSYFEENNLFMKINYSQILEKVQYFPHFFSLEIPDKHTTVSLEFSEVKINGEVRSESFKLKRPQGARVVYLTSE